MGYMKKLDEKVIFLYRNGATLQQIAQQYNCTANAVRLYLLKNNITMRKRSYHKININALNMRLLELSKANAQASVKQLAREFGVGEVTMRKYLRKANASLVRAVVPRMRPRQTEAPNLQ